MSDTVNENALLKATKRVLRSLVRLFIKQGVAYPQIIEILKELYVKEVHQTLEESGERVTHSRISIMSGVHRKDVKRLLEIADLNEQPERKVSATSRILSIWCGSDTYLDNEGNPVSLPRTSQTENEISFDGLISSQISDVRPRAIFDDWLNREIIRLDENGLIHLVHESIFPGKEQEEKLYYFARNTADHIAACDYNLTHSDHSLPERSLFFDGLSQQSINQLQQSAEKWAHQSLMALNSEALKLADRDDSQGDHHERFTYGIYFYREQEKKDV